jgi:hypothetical protein
LPGIYDGGQQLQFESSSAQGRIKRGPAKSKGPVLVQLGSRFQFLGYFFHCLVNGPLQLGVMVRLPVS